MADYKVDIFKLLDRLSLGDKEVWLTFTAEEQKAISPLVIMRWLSCTPNSGQIRLINHLVNHLIFPLAKHPELLMKLMACCTEKRKTGYTWIGQKKSGGSKKLSIQVLQEYYNYSSREAAQCLSLLTKEDIVGMSEKLGWDKVDIAKLRKEL
jgi:hypothetical protein